MSEKYLVDEIKNISLSMFRKNFFGVFHGSISAKIEDNKFIINKNNAIFDGLNESNMITLSSKKDYRWNEASIDSDIHLSIYKNISDAKFICYTMPPFTVAYSLEHNSIIPKDYFGDAELGKIDIYDPKNFDDWYERAEVEIYRYFKEKNKKFVVVKGYGVYSYDRDISNLAKTVALIENSCKILTYLN